MLLLLMVYLLACDVSDFFPAVVDAEAIAADDFVLSCASFQRLPSGIMF